MWANILFGYGDRPGDDAELLSVEDEIAALGGGSWPQRDH